MTSYVFSLGLIPVQEWISQARRSRDLRAGSVFLWHVMAKLLARLEGESARVEVWTPLAPEGGFAKLAKLRFEALWDISYGIPNRASGICEAEDGESLGRFFQELEREVAAAWGDLRDLAMKELQRMASPAFWSEWAPHWSTYRDLTSNGEDCPLTLIWVAEPAGEGAGRKERLKVIDARFADLKRSRPLRAWELGAPVGKCSQCGRREAIGPRESFEAWQAWHSRRSQDPWIQQGQRLDAGERLCYVCLVRRMAGYAATERKDFPSTGEVAARGWLARLEKVPHLRQLVGQLRRTALGEQDFGRALYGSVKELPDSLQREVESLRRDIRNGITDQNGRPASPDWPSPLALEPPSHLALFTFDGDDMGRRVQADPHGTPRALARFAKAAASLLEQHKATPFYLAGDEGLAMAPAEEALDLALALREEFLAVWGDREDRPTLSVGVAFFEQGRPLRGAILAARAALESAKERKGKNALGVAVETASGSRWGFTARWGDEWERIRRSAALVREGRLSAGWAYDAERFVETLPKGENEWGTDVAAAARAELRRLFLRRIQGEGKNAEERRTDRRRRWECLPGESWWERNEEGLVPPPDPQQFHLIGFLARQGTALGAGMEEE